MSFRHVYRLKSSSCRGFGGKFAFTAARGFSGSQIKACRNAARGFTLAEVLITLVIIGVIAAITIPNLMQSYKKHQVEVGVKEAYSILSNAIKMSEAENGDMDNWNYNLNPNDFFEQYLSPYLKVSRKCGCNGSVCTTLLPAGSCFPKENGIYNFRQIDGKTTNYVGYDFFTFLLSNGMSAGVFTGRGTWGKGAYIIVDVDGKDHGLSVIGKDAHYFSIKPVYDSSNNINKPIFVTGAENLRWGPLHINRSTEQLKSTSISTSTGGYSGTCNINAASSDVAYPLAQCTTIIARNGWKIPDDYPIKKF